VKFLKSIDLCCQKRPVGRPRSEGTRAAILASAYELLKTHPVAEITTVQIARKAGASTATVYRWWTTKEALLLDAFLDRVEELKDLKLSGSPLEQLRAHLVNAGRHFAGPHGIVMARLMTAIQDNEILREDYINRVLKPHTRDKHDLVKAAIEAGELPASMKIDFFLDCLFGPIVGRLIMRHEPITDEYVDAVFSQVVAGVRALGAEKAQVRP